MTRVKSDCTPLSVWLKGRSISRLGLPYGSLPLEVLDGGPITAVNAFPILNTPNVTDT